MYLPIFFFSSLVTLGKEQAEAFYAEHAGKFFHQRLVEHMTSGPCQPLILAKVCCTLDEKSHISYSGYKGERHQRVEKPDGTDKSVPGKVKGSSDRPFPKLRPIFVKVVKDTSSQAVPTGSLSLQAYEASLG